MPVEFIIESGPDKGRTFRVHSPTEVRFGRQAGCQALIRDPSWKGVIRVLVSQGQISVVNEMATSGYLGQEIFSPREEKIWFNGMRLQPTADTVLLLKVVSSLEAQIGDRDPVEEVTGTRDDRKKKQQVQLLVILLCLPIIVVAFFFAEPEVSNEPKTIDQTRADFRQLEQLLEYAGKDAKYAPLVKGIPGLLQDARFYEMWNRPAEALDRYLKIRTEVDRILNDPKRPTPELDYAGNDPLEKTRQYVSHRILELNPRVKTRTR